MIDWQIKHYRKVGSTSSRLKSRAKKGSPAGLVITAGQQTAGRGRAGRSWYSPAGRGLYFSFLLRPDLEPARCPLLSPLTAEAARQTLVDLIGADLKRFKFKRPNDLYWSDRKLGGILLESTSRGGKLGYVVVSLGLNLTGRTWPGWLRGRAVSLEEVTGRKIDREVFLKKFLVNFARLDKEFLDKKGGLMRKSTDNFR